ncbi:MAG: hypothetical protein EPO21_24295 [Chloroflexota bacterium]|nr:MAG: hypothetical protein EPO21_24295 [Chloroflexota bacterium]
MLERLHEHINLELGINTRTDTIYVVTAIIFNFVMLGINASVAAGASRGDATARAVLIITMVLSILVNGIAVLGLLTGRQTRHKLLRGLLKMYTDAGVGQYYDPTLLSNYDRRYVMFTAIIALLGVAGILIPLVMILVPSGL